MAQIFRIHTQGGANTVNHWGPSHKISSQAIGSIKDPNGASAAKEITSIPSPFARMDLIKTAFAEVVKSGNLDGTSIYHKMVSDCLDIAEIFFNFDKYSNFIEIIEWNRINDLSKLSRSYVQGHKQLADTYNLFLTQDAQTYNFASLQSLFILKCTDPSALAGNNYLGATSPATFFFSSANDLSYISHLIDFGGYKPFGGNYIALHKRDVDFKKFWFLLRKVDPYFAQHFPEVDNYLTASFNQLTLNERNIINQLTLNDYHNLNDISVGGAGNLVNVLGIPIKQKHKNTANIQNSSDFTIGSTKNTINGMLPLVLPVDRFTQPLNYVNAVWSSNTKVPYQNTTPISQRLLPGDGAQYPYLTISDFLEDTIVSLPYMIDRQSFFDGNLQGAQGKSYLLPVTDLFFQFFSVDDLKKMIKLKTIAGGVVVELRIPIKNKQYIEYSRMYFEYNPPDMEYNKGAVIDDDFIFALFPNISFNYPNDAYYRFGVIAENFGTIHNYNVIFANSNGRVDSIIRNDNYSKHKQCKNFILENSNFDYLRLCSVNGKSGVIIPNFHKEGGTDQYTFAIDFGTTNTHIEYSVNGSTSKPFDVEEKDKQLHLLSQSTNIDDTLTYIFDYDFIPEKIGKSEEFSLPMRTALSVSKNTDWELGVFPLAHTNVAFWYEKRVVPEYNRILTGLKWSVDIDNMKKVKAYFESLFLILRNKVILNNGNLSSTKIVWFYPISMTRHRYNLFKTIWDDAYQKYFGNNLQNLISITESIAPYEYYKRTVGNTSNMVAIDIGGGTSDMVIVVGEEIKHITSFRFAANSIFGDGYATNNVNGIVREFQSSIETILDRAGLSELKVIGNEISNEKLSSDIASFFFSLKNNKKVIERNLADRIDFNKILQIDDTQKIVFIFFYVAIIYHLAQIMKNKKIPMPRHITFSGNGSKVVQILTKDNKLLANFTKLIFEKIYCKRYDSNGLSILQNAENPKEATCKGGISSPVSQDYEQISGTKVVLSSSDYKSFTSFETYGTINKQEYLKKTVDEVKKFIDFVLKLNAEISYKDNFGISNESLNIAKEECYKDLDIYASKGLELKLKEVSDDDAIEETFFFYPLNGMLNALSIAIYERFKK